MSAHTNSHPAQSQGIPFFFPLIVPESVVFVRPQGPQPNAANPTSQPSSPGEHVSSPSQQQFVPNFIGEQPTSQQAPQIHFYFTLPPATAATAQQPGTPLGTPFVPYFFLINPLPTSQQPSFQGQPPASQKATQNLPVVNITPHLVANQASCAICQDAFNTDSSSPPVRQMPCGHIFCEPCLFPWLAQSNTCPTCRFEILTDNDEYNAGVRRRMREREETCAKTKEAKLGHHHDTMSCALAAVGVCDVESEGSRVVAIPQCGHRFHAPCLRTSLLIEGHDLKSGEHEGTINFHCPSCRANSTIESTMIALEEEQAEQRQMNPSKVDTIRRESVPERAAEDERYRTTVEEVNDDMDVDVDL